MRVNSVQIGVNRLNQSNKTQQDNNSQPSFRGFTHAAEDFIARNARHVTDCLGDIEFIRKHPIKVDFFEASGRFFIESEKNPNHVCVFSSCFSARLDGIFQEIKRVLKLKSEDPIYKIFHERTVPTIFSDLQLSPTKYLEGTYDIVTDVKTRGKEIPETEFRAFRHKQTEYFAE